MLKTVRYAIKFITPFKTELAVARPVITIQWQYDFGPPAIPTLDAALLFLLIAVIATVGPFHAGR